ncbi:MAG: hypothetical protein D6709_09785 [Chloroflexi bacterium]|jgi:hypothetical protein|nr:MAG: hypothetical protein D6709_09785 [Chloroflexota bacterium]
MRAMRKTNRTIAVALGLSIALVACGGAPAGDPAQRIEAYLQARVKGEVERMIALSCAAWEPNARLEATSIQGRSPSLDALACRTDATEGDTALITCTGRIITNYDGERREFNLAERQFKAIQEGGEWRMCGYRAI